MDAVKIWPKTKSFLPQSRKRYSSVSGTYESYNAFKGTGNDAGQSITQTSDGQYLVAAQSTSGDAGGYDILFMRINSAFSLASQKYIGGNQDDYASGICTTADGGSVIVGSTLSYTNGGTDVFVISLSSDDSLKWQKNTGGVGNDYGFSVRCLSNGNIAIAGQYSFSYSVGWFLLMSADGNQLLSSPLFTTTSSTFNSVSVLADSTYIVAGYNVKSTICPYLVNYGSSSSIWKKTLSVSTNSPFYSVTAGTDSNIVACGYSGSPVAFYVVRLSSSGEIVWSKQYGSSDVTSVCYSVVNLIDGSYCGAGSIVSSENSANNTYIIKFSSEGNLITTQSFGGTGNDYFKQIISESDGGYTAVGGTTSFPIISSTEGVLIKGGYFDCSIGYYLSSLGCIKCPAGTFSAVKRASECSSCPAGSYQPGLGQSSCILCPVGTYQNSTSQTECINCPIGKYNPNNGSSSCTECPDGYYQDTSGQTSCKTCNTNYYPNVLKTLCLYKGIFSDIDSFTSSSFKANCFDSDGNIITPYTEACRTSYRSLCCNGSSILSTSGPICNYGLELASSSSLYNNYCSACTFFSQTQCPAQGVCWNDSLYINNSYDPYSSFSSACLLAIKSYCGEKLQTNADDAECYIFKSDCAFATIASASYGTSCTSFTIVSNQKLSTAAISNDIFNNDFSKATVSKKSGTEIVVDVSAMASPPKSFQFKSEGLKTFCDVSFSESILHNITMPTATSETVSITSSSSTANKCMSLVISSSITKPYSWDLEYTWNSQYFGISTPSNLTEIVNKTNTSTLTLDPEYLIADQTILFYLNITNPFSQSLISNTLSLPIKNPVNSIYPCSPCQLHNRTKCLNYDSICWDNYTTYSASYPLLYTENCLAGIALECYSIWTQNGLSDSQCADFTSHFDFEKMSIKPNVTSCKYYVDGVLKLRIVFDVEVKTTILSTCNAIFNEATIQSLGSSAQCSWTSARILEIVYSATNNLVTNLTLREDALYYNYKYSANPADNVTLIPTLPDLSGTVSISAASNVSACNTLLLTAVTQVSGIFEYSYSWNLSYSLSSVSSTILSNFESFAVQNRKILVVSSENLISEAYLKVNLTVTVPLLSSTISATTTIYFTSDTPEVSFASSELYQLNLIGNQTNDMGLIITADPCNTGTTEETNIVFTVYSGTTYTSITIRGTREISIENILQAKYKLYKTLQANINSGFEYNHFYNLTVCASISGKEAISCKTKIIGLFKPAISAVIMGLPNFVGGSESILFNGARSSIPLETDETVKFTWQCVSCYSYVSNSYCSCPYLSLSQTYSRAFTLDTSKLSHSRKYKFRLTIISLGGIFLRTGSADASFITISCAVSSVYGKIIYGKQNDMYFTVTVNYLGKDSDLSFQWSLVEVSSTLSNNTFSYSMLNTFVYKLFQKNGITLDSVCLNEDQEIPDPLLISNITNNESRIFGIDKASLIPEYYYTFAVLMKEPVGYSAALITIQASALPATRSLLITPTSGYGLETTFLFIFPVSSGISDSEEIIKLLAVRCNGSEELVYSTVGSSTSFKGVLSPGKSDCDHQVTIILRVILNEVSVDINSTITVLASSNAATTTIATLLSQAKSTDSYISTLSTLSSITLTSVTEESEQAQTNIAKVYSLMSNIDNLKTGFVAYLDDSSKLQFLNSSLLIWGNLLENNILSNLNLTLQSLIEEKIYNYISSCESISDGVYLIPSAIRALSASASLKKERGGNQSYALIDFILEKMRLMKLQNLQPGAPCYKVDTSTISLKIFKQYSTDFNLPHEVANGIGQNTKSRIELPAGLTSKVISSLPFPISSYTTFMICTSMTLLKMNPYQNIKSNALVYLSAISSLSYNTNWIEAYVIQTIYRDLRRGQLSNIVDIYSQPIDLIQLSFNGFSLLKDASIVEYGAPVKIGALDNNNVVVYHHPYSSTQDSRDNSIFVPLFKVGSYWANLNFTLTDISSTEIVSENHYLGYSGDYTTGHTADIIVDVVPDTKTVLLTGDYKTLSGFNSEALDENSVQIFFIFSVLILVALIALSGILYYKDKTRIAEQELLTLEYLVMKKQIPPPIGYLQTTFVFLNSIKKIGIKSVSQEKKSSVFPEFVPSTTRAMGDIETTNGYTSLSEEEMQHLDTLYNLYQEKHRTQTTEELLSLFAKELGNYPPLSRRARDFIEDTTLGYTGFTLLLMQQQFASAFFMVSLCISRPIKLLVVTLVLFGELTAVGLFIDPNESNDVFDNFALLAIIYGILAIIIITPIMVLLKYFLSAYSLIDTMSRQEIINKEQCFYYLEKIGYGLILSLLIIEFVAIDNFAMNFNGTAFKLWLMIFAVALLIDNVFFYALRMLILISYAACLRGSMAGRCFILCTGLISCCLMELRKTNVVWRYPIGGGICFFITKYSRVRSSCSAILVLSLQQRIPDNAINATKINTEKIKNICTEFSSRASELKPERVLQSPVNNTVFVSGTTSTIISAVCPVVQSPEYPRQ